MKETLYSALAKACMAVGISNARIALEYPENPEHGDFSTNVALAHAKEAKLSPRVLAEKIAAELKAQNIDIVSAIEIAGPGFINFKIKDDAMTKTAIQPLMPHAKNGMTVMVEYTDPNPFKVFHIGHLMANAIGESVSRLVASTGTDVIRACYQGDVGLHVAKTVWAIVKHGIPENYAGSNDPAYKVKWLGERYVEGSSHDDDPAIQKEIAYINKKIFDRSDAGINQIYDYGRKWSLEYFDTMYARLGTAFDEFYFESQVADRGLAVVREFLKKDVFEESDGAIVFKGEEFGLHTRVFVNSQGLPTYEAKEIGLNITKFEKHPNLAGSIIVTGNEINEYFKVLKKVLSLVAPGIAEKTTHISHGMLRFTEGKMSSRKGNIISAEELINETKATIKEKMGGRELTESETELVADQVAVAAIKYSILRQAPGSDVIFDRTKSISTEGDSGPYLQYSAVRANSVLEKAKALTSGKMVMPAKAGLLEKLLTRFNDVVARAAADYAPQHIATYLTDLAAAFNSFYNANMILDEKEPESAYRVELTRAFRDTMTAGLNLLGIKVPKKM